jgi:hypothetical protein
MYTLFTLFTPGVLASGGEVVVPMNEKPTHNLGTSSVEESAAGVAPVAPLERPEPPAARPQRRSRGKLAAPRSAELLPMPDANQRGRTPREQKRAMGLIRKQTTQAVMEANRANSLNCTGPVTDVGKMNARLNAVKHGLTSVVGGLAVRQLGEEPSDLDKIRKDLRKSFCPIDHFEFLLLDQIVENRWRRRRAVRAESSLLVAQRLKFELEYGQKLAGEGRSSDAIGEARAAAESGLIALLDSSAKFNLILQCLRAAQEAVEREGFGEEGMRRLEAVYGPDPGLAGAVLLTNYQQGQEGVRGGTNEAAPEPSARQAFLDCVAAEIACFEKLLELHETTAVSLAAAEAGAQSALSHTDTQRIARYETFLDRQFERLVKQFNEWRDAHSDGNRFIYGDDAEADDLEKLQQEIRARLEKGRALTGAFKAARGEDAKGGSCSNETPLERGCAQEKP